MAKRDLSRRRFLGSSAVAASSILGAGAVSLVGNQPLVAQSDTVDPSDNQLSLAQGPSLNASWVHGNALTVEQPENLSRVGYYGWGADMEIIPGKESWFHIPLPTPVIMGNVRTVLERVFLMFSTDQGYGKIRDVHVYDGSYVIQEFNDLDLWGDHRNSLDNQNTFNLSTPYTVVFGIGISFYCSASIGFDTQIPGSRLILASAGGDYTVN